MNKRIDIDALSKSRVGAIPPPVDCGLIGHLDRQALRWIAASPLMFAAFGDASGIGVTIGGGEAGFASGDAPELRLPVARIDDPALALPGKGFGSLFLLPCIGETMRVNGKVREVRDGEIRIAVEECHGHSGQALLRSEFWSALLEILAPRGVCALAAARRFMALASVDAAGRVELSPKDDAAGPLGRIKIRGPAFADHTASRVPGHLQVPQPQAAAIMLVLGSAQVARLSGIGGISAERTQSAQFVFEDETSGLAAIIEDGTAEISESATLMRLDLWSGAAPTPGTDRAKPFGEHIRRSLEEGAGAELANAAVSVPGVCDLLRQGLETAHEDYLHWRSI